MAVAWFSLLFAVVVGAVRGQTNAPFFTRESIAPVAGKHGRWLMPGDFVEIYGRHLAPTGGCAQALPNRGPYPTEVCDTQVTVSGIPAELLAVLENQINLKVPPGAPTSGDAAIVVTVHCISSQPVMVPFGVPKLTLSLASPAYVHMPVWIEFEHARYEPSYPYSLRPDNLGGGRFEVRRNGVMLKPVEVRHDTGPMVFSGPPNGSIAPPDSPRWRLPLHLQYRFDVPGKYEIRFLGTQWELDPVQGIRSVQTVESDWTEIEILPYSAAQRRRWIREQMARMPSSPGLLVGDAVPALLALPNALALSAILPELYRADDLVRGYVAASLAMFDKRELAKQLTRMVREKGLTEEIARLLDQREELFEG